MLGAFLGAAACDLPGADHGQVVVGRLNFGGGQRTYRLFVPPHPPQAFPLVILLHGAGGDGKSMESGTGFDAEAERLGFLAVYPDGVNHDWNAGFCCPRPVPVMSDDVGFAAALIDHLSRSRHLDPARVYVAGFSNGGYMAFRLACEMAPRPAAIAAAGADSQECSAGPPASPVSVLQVHGTSDDRNQGHVQGLRSGTWVETQVDAADQWSSLDGCNPSPATSRSGRVSRSDWASCRGGTEVLSYSIAGGGHTWPRESPDATRLAADFFMRHHR